MPSRETVGTGDRAARDNVEVKATALFKGRRLLSIVGLTVKQYRELQSGQKTRISKAAFDAESQLYERT